MIDIRIGNDIPIVWSFFTRVDGTKTPYILDGKDVMVEMSDRFGRRDVVNVEIVENSVRWTWRGKDQSRTGTYTFTFFENFGQNGMKALDKIKPIRLVEAQETVQRGIMEGCCSSMEVSPISLESEMERNTSGGVSSYAELSDKPKINHIILVGDKTLEDLGIASLDDIAAETERATAAEQTMSDALAEEIIRATTKEAELKRDIENIPQHPYLSLERIRKYLYKVTFDSLPEDDGGDSVIAGGCSSFVRDGKLHRSLDWGYDNVAEFIVRTKNFEGMSFIAGLNDGDMNDSLIAQLPYRVNDGVNNYGIKVSTHILYNDWQWSGVGQSSIPLTRLPFIILNTVKSMGNIATDLQEVLTNVYCPEGLADMGYLLQIFVTDGTTSYAILPPTEANQPFVLQDITTNPKLTNFRWVNQSTVVRGNLQTRPTGVERFNLMPCSLEELRFTKAYESPNRLSEFIGLENTTKDSSDTVLEAIYDEAHALYLDRERDGRTWQSLHAVVYGNKMESLCIQENYKDDIICGDKVGIIVLG